MPSITAWTRLEPDIQQADLDVALQARLYDPLWMLARQWQTGEFGAEDAGSPVSVRLRGDRFPLARFATPQAANPAGAAFDPARLPLETLVEREAIRTVGPDYDRRLAAEAGLYFLSLLTRRQPAGLAQLRSAYLATYPLDLPPASVLNALDPAARRSLSLLAGRAPNGFRLYADLRAALTPTGGALPAHPVVAAAAAAAVTEAAREYLAWYESLYAEAAGDSQAWQPARMEYAFNLSASAGDHALTLAAREYTQSEVDWYSFDLADGQAAPAAGDPPPETFVSTVMPAPATFRGMPSDRWWEFEDARVNFGRVDAAPDDLLRMALTGFALLYSNDWFVAPLTARAGAIYRIRSLVVTDAFGVRTLIPHYAALDGPAAGWRLYTLDTTATPTAPAAGDLLFVPPVLAAHLRSEPVEEVVLARDEMANLAWAVEKTIAGPAGTSIDRFEAYRRTAAAQPVTGPNGGSGANGANDAGDEWSYRLATPVPDYWFPLLPVRIKPDQPAIRLVLGRMLESEDNGAPPPAPTGRLLAGQTLSLFEEEVPRSAVRVTRVWRYTRAADGSTCVWIGRCKRPGRGPAFSGLRYDVIVP